MNNQLWIAIGAFAVLFFVLNLIFLLIIFFMRKKVSAVGAWSTTMGKIVSSELERRKSADNVGSTLYPVIEYSYKVNNKTYQSNVIMAGGYDVGGSGAPKVIEKYPAGSQVIVYYNPQNPQEAVLEKKSPVIMWMWIGLAVLDFMLCGMLVPIYFLFGM